MSEKFTTYPSNRAGEAWAAESGSDRLVRIAAQP
jgi:hypothetical protein